MQASTNTFTQQIADFKEWRQQLMELWREGIPQFCPDLSQWIVWQEMHDPTHLMTAVLRTIKKFKKTSGEMSEDHLVRYCSSVANSLKHERTVSTNPNREVNEHLQ